jgi:hypothetical protein
VAQLGVVVAQLRGRGGSAGVAVAQLGVVVAQLFKATWVSPDCNAAVPGSIPASSTVS